MKSITKDHVKLTVLAPGKYAIDVEPIPPRNRNNREIHLDYLRHLKESVETLREIVKEAKHAPTPLIRKKQVTFEEQCDTSNSNTYKHVEQLTTQKTNVPVPPSTRVNCCTNASGSQPRSNTKKNRISPAKGANKKKVKEHLRINKSNLRISNRVDSSSSSKHTVGTPYRVPCWTVRFGNDHFGAIMGYGDFVIGDSVISRLVHDKKPDLTFFHVFGALCYPINDSEDLGKLQPTTDIGIFVGYTPSRKGTGPAPTFFTPGQISSGLVPNSVPAAPYVGPAVPIPVNSAGTPSSTTIDQDAPSPSHSPSSSALQSPSSHQGVATGSTIIEDNPFAPVENNPFINVFAPEPSFEASSSGAISSAESTHVTQPHHYLEK
ncbi:hypothetical protein Tco_0163195 [Tanacetum coccineum]